MKQMAFYLVITISIVSILPRAEAGLSPSQIIPTTNAERTTDLAKIQNILEQKLVRNRLEKYGLTQEEINSRVNRLNDQQLHNLSYEYLKNKIKITYKLLTSLASP